MLSECFAWWLRQLGPLLPRRAAPDAIIVAIDDLAARRGAFLVRRRGVEQYVAPTDNDSLARPPALPASLPCLLRLPPGAVLSRTLRLPAAAGAGAENFGAAAAFELDRVTPFDAGEIFYRLGTPARAGSGLTATLTFTLRAPLAPLLAGLAKARLAPAAIETPEGRIPLAAPARNRLLMTALVALAVLVLAVPVLRQQQALDDAQAQIAALTPAASEAGVLRARLAAAASSREVLAAAAAAGPLHILATLTAALPDDTVLADLTLKSGTLTFDGQSADAARLIALLAATPGIRTPSFTAPVTRTMSGTADVFSIRAVVAP
jgi:general secretion pathway protein L